MKYQGAFPKILFVSIAFLKIDSFPRTRGTHSYWSNDQAVHTWSFLYNFEPSAHSYMENYFTFIASFPERRVCCSWSRKIRNGRPYSSKARLPIEFAAIFVVKYQTMFQVFTDLKSIVLKKSKPGVCGSVGEFLECLQNF